MTRAEPDAGGATSARPLRAEVAWAYVALGVLLAVAMLLGRDSDWVDAVFPVVGVTCAIALFVGRNRNRPALRRPWSLFAWGSVAFIVGGALRQALSGSPLSPLADAATLSGYACCFGAFVLLLRGRRATRPELHELVDGVIVLVAGAVVAVDLFTVPTMSLNVLPPSYAMLQGLYPVVDVGWLFVCVLLAWTTALRVTSYWFVVLAALGVLVGDVGYARIGTHGHLVGSPLLDLPFVLAFALLGASALHPSVRSLSDVQRRPVQAWSAARLLVLAPALAVPPVFMLVRPTGSAAEPYVVAVGAFTITIALLARAVGAVNAYARNQEGLRRAARRDPLTGLLNRTGLLARLTLLLREAERTGHRVDVLFLDVDGFKFVNDSWGHGLGDELLEATARRLREVTDGSDLVARIGGDEFVVARFVTQEERSGADIAARIVDAFRPPFELTMSSVAVTASIGLRCSEGHDTSENLIRDADTAMYRAKAAGRNQVAIFDPSMRDSVRQRVETELALRYALDRDEFALHYQPVVDMVSGELRGFEALLRWTHPGLGPVSPMDFIPVAEETGIIVDIGAWVVTEALRQLAQWRREHAPLGDDVYVAVNVSARQLRDPALAAHVALLLRRFAVPADNLVLEISESAMVTDVEVASEPLRALDALGVRIAVDDFGTGYSSLAHLRRFPVSILKIDRSFVDGIADAEGDGEIVRAVVGMADALGLGLVAEGVETEEQRVLLARLGVTSAQGWLFGRPAPAESAWVREPVGQPTYSPL